MHDVATGQQLLSERAFLAALDGSCETPIAGLAVIEGSDLFLRGEVLRPDGSEKLSGQRRGLIADGADMGRDLAKDLLSQAGPEFFSWR